VLVAVVVVTIVVLALLAAVVEDHQERWAQVLLDILDKGIKAVVAVLPHLTIQQPVVEVLVELAEPQQAHAVAMAVLDWHSVSAAKASGTQVVVVEIFKVVAYKVETAVLVVVA